MSSDGRSTKWWLLILAWALLPALGLQADEDLAARRREVASMTPAQRKDLQNKLDRFSQLSPEDQQRLRALHAEIVSASDGEHLQRLLERYTRWLGTLPSGQRADLLSRPPEERLAEIKRLVRQQEAERLGNLLAQELSEQDYATLMSWLDELIQRRERDLLAKFPFLEERLKSIQDPKWRRWTIYFSLRHGPSKDALKPDAADLARLKEQLSPKARQLLDKAHSADNMTDILERWMQAAAFSKRRFAPVAKEELRKFYREKIEPRERERLESLPPEVMQRELTRLYHAQRLQQSFEGPGPMFPFGGPGPGAGPNKHGRGPFRKPGESGSDERAPQSFKPQPPREKPNEPRSETEEPRPAPPPPRSSPDEETR